jgi:hypothetical protein
MNYIVSTTIHPLSEALRKFDALPDWRLIVVGDLKTPPDFKLDRGIYVSPKDQESYDRKLSNAIGWNCVQRRNLGILIAYEAGAEVIALVDDDNIPYESWGQNLLLGRLIETHFYVAPSCAPAFDPVGALVSHLWHRGFPLQLLDSRDYGHCMIQRVCPEIQADFWDGDPDVDAICRMEHNPVCRFGPAYFPMASNKPSPFNSQNTFLLRRVLPDYFLAPGINRLEDIWASYYVQARGFRVVYGAPSVYQKRNSHCLTRDMVQEFLGYEKTINLIHDLAQDPRRIYDYLPAAAKRAWQLYRRHFDGTET